mmetsp:Transcript_148216/g.412776  ORF Transcript_148216/g.412776 Transcript_148216/m.412776 type:complete len:230 (-) Transcript_148216:334-1023(-)
MEQDLPEEVGLLRSGDRTSGASGWLAPVAIKSGQEEPAARMGAAACFFDTILGGRWGVPGKRSGKRRKASCCRRIDSLRRSSSTCIRSVSEQRFSSRLVFRNSCPTLRISATSSCALRVISRRALMSACASCTASFTPASSCRTSPCRPERLPFTWRVCSRSSRISCAVWIRRSSSSFGVGGGLAKRGTGDGEVGIDVDTGSTEMTRDGCCSSAGTTTTSGTSEASAGG